MTLKNGVILFMVLRLKNGKKIDEKIFDMLYIHIDAAAMEAKKLAEKSFATRDESWT